MTTFIDACLAGTASPADIDDHVAAWHDGPDPRSLPEALGFFHEEYVRWVMQPGAVPAIIESHRRRRAQA